MSRWDAVFIDGGPRLNATGWGMPRQRLSEGSVSPFMARERAPRLDPASISAS